MLAKRCQTPGTGDTNLPHLPALQWKSFCGYHTQALLTGIQIQNKLGGGGNHHGRQLGSGTDCNF